MKKIYLLFLYTSFILTSNAQNIDENVNLEIKFRDSEKNNLDILAEIWNTKEINIYPEIISIDNYPNKIITINLGLLHKHTINNIKQNEAFTTRIILDQFINKDDFHSIRLLYKEVNENGITRKEKTIAKNIFEVPVLQGCNDKLPQNDIKKCFSEKIKKMVEINTPKGKYVHLNLDKKSSKFKVSFTITEGSLIVIDRVSHTDPTIRKEFTELFKSITVQKPACISGKPQSTSYSIPINLNVE